MFVDYAGPTIPIHDSRHRRRSTPAQLFVAALGASNYTYAEATPSQQLEDWIWLARARPSNTSAA